MEWGRVSLVAVTLLALSSPWAAAQPAEADAAADTAVASREAAADDTAGDERERQRKERESDYGWVLFGRFGAPIYMPVWVFAAPEAADAEPADSGRAEELRAQVEELTEAPAEREAEAAGKPDAARERRARARSRPRPGPYVMLFGDQEPEAPATRPVTRSAAGPAPAPPAASGPEPLSVPSFSKTFIPDTIGPGSTTTLRFDIVNSDPTPVTDLAFTDILPAGVTIADPAVASTNCVDGMVSAPPGGSTITFTDGRLGGSKACRVLVNVTSSTAGTHTNTTGALTSSAGSSGTATDDLDVDAGFPGFTKIFTPSTIELGGRSTLTFTIDNTANTSPATFLDFTDTLPVGMAIANPAAASTTCGSPPSTVPELTATPGTRVIDFFVFGSALFPAVDELSLCTVTVDVTTSAGGSLDNVSDVLDATVGGEIESVGKATDRLVSTAAALGLRKRFVNDPVTPGNPVTLRFRIDNRNRDFSATGIGFTDDLKFTPSMGITLAGGPFPDPPCGAGSMVSEAGGVLTFSGGTLAPGAFCAFTVTLAVPDTESFGAFLNTTSAVTGTVDGSPVVGNTASDKLFVDPAPIFTKTFTDDPVGAGGSVTLEFSLTNTISGKGMMDLEFEDDLNTAFPGLAANSLIAAGGLDPEPIVDPCGTGSELTIFDLNDTGGLPSPPFPNFPPDPTLLIFTGGSLDPAGGADDSCTFDVVLDVPSNVPGGTYTNTTGEIRGDLDTFGPFTGPPAEGDVIVLGAPRLTKDFTDDPVTPGDQVTLEFTLRHRPDSPGDATGITFTDDLTITGISGLAAAAGELPLAACGGTLSSSAGGTLLTFSGGSLVPGGECIFSLLLDVPAGAGGGTFTNTTSGVGATVDGVPASSKAATAQLVIANVAFTKEFTDDPVPPGGTVTLEFTLTNLSASAATDISFTDNLDPSVAEDLTVITLPADGFCGPGSTLTTFDPAGAVVLALLMSDGSLAAMGSPGDSCTFEVTLGVDAATPDGRKQNVTSDLSVTIGGTPTTVPPAVDDLVVESDLLFLTKEFTDDPVTPGSSVNLRFTLDNLDPDDPITSIAFSDDLDAALSGLLASGLPFPACGGTVSSPDGGMTVELSGGSLAGGGSCFFDVTVSVPAVPGGTSAVNTTSTVTGLLGGLPVVGGTASDTLSILNLLFTKSFDGPSFPGGTPVLTFTITNLSASDSVSDLSFTDDLDDTLTDLVATGLPSAPCGAGSAITGTSLLAFSGGTLPPSGVCSFDVDLLVPATAPDGDFLNVTSDLTIFGTPVASAATATLTVLPLADLSVTLAPVYDPAVGAAVQLYDIEVENLGPSTATDVALDFELPVGSFFLGAEPTGIPCMLFLPSTVSCDLGSLISGASVDVTIGAFTDGRFDGTRDSEALVGSATVDPVPGNNEADASVEVARPRAIVATTDEAGDEFLAILAKEADSTLGLIFAEAAGGATRRYSVTGADVRAVALTEVPDFDGTPAPEVAVLGFGFDGSVQVDVVDVGSAALLGSHPVPGGPYVPIDLAPLPDIGGTPAPDLAVLTRDLTDGSVHTLVIDAADGSLLADHTVVGAGTVFPLDMALVPDFGGTTTPELAIVSKDASTESVEMRVIDGASGVPLGPFPHVLGTDLFPFAVEAFDDIGGSPDPDAAILLRTASGGVVLTATLDLGTGAGVKDVFFDPALLPVDMETVPDFAGGPAPELAVLGRKGFDVVVEIKDAGDETLVGLLIDSDAPKAPVPLGLAVHPDFAGDPEPDVSVLFEFDAEDAQVNVFNAAGGLPLFSFFLP